MTELGFCLITLMADQRLQVEPDILRARSDASSNYILVGCLGGIGQRLSRWMVERDARCLTFLVRSTKHGESVAAFVHGLSSRGASMLMPPISQPCEKRLQVQKSLGLSGVLSMLQW